MQGEGLEPMVIDLEALELVSGGGSGVPGSVTERSGYIGAGS